MSPLEYLATLLWSLVFIKMVWAEPFFDSLRFLSILPSLPPNPQNRLRERERPDDLDSLAVHFFDDQ